MKFDLILIFRDLKYICNNMQQVDNASRKCFNILAAILDTIFNYSKLMVNWQSGINRIWNLHIIISYQNQSKHVIYTSKQCYPTVLHLAPRLYLKNCALNSLNCTTVGLQNTINNVTRVSCIFSICLSSYFIIFIFSWNSCKNTFYNIWIFYKFYFIIEL